MVYSSGLENRQARKGLESSNLSPSANVMRNRIRFLIARTAEINSARPAALPDAPISVPLAFYSGTSKC